MIPQKHKHLLKAEKRNKKTLKTALFLLLFRSTAAPKDRLDLMIRQPIFTRNLTNTILDLHQPARALANDDTADFLDQDEDPAEVSLTPERAKQVTTAAKSLIKAVIAAVSVAMADDQEFPDALEGALEEVDARVGRIASTETFTAYVEQYLANTIDLQGEWQWDALLDKRTCPQCESLNGLKWAKESDVPACPAHVRCRCIIEFYPAS